jgi:hypothetical protein
MPGMMPTISWSPGRARSSRIPCREGAIGDRGAYPRFKTPELKREEYYTMISRKEGRYYRI